MKYVFKIVGNFNDENFEKILNKIASKYISLYTNKTLFIALKSWADREGSEALLNKAFRPVRDFYIEEVNEKNVSDLPPAIGDWCLNQLLRLDTERFEEENQAKLQQIWESMDRMEEQFEQKMIERRGDFGGNKS